jgi:hypothetical protein
MPADGRRERPGESAGGEKDYRRGTDMAHVRREMDVRSVRRGVGESRSVRSVGLPNGSSRLLDGCSLNSPFCGLRFVLALEPNEQRYGYSEQQR